jgi:hypothetical protein
MPARKPAFARGSALTDRCPRTAERSHARGSWQQAKPISAVGGAVENHGVAIKPEAQRACHPKLLPVAPGL